MGEGGEYQKPVIKKITPNNYQRLGVPRDASSEQLKTAYRDQAKQFHPDKGPKDQKEGRGELMKGLNEAVETLSDSDKRGPYDEKLKLEEDAALKNSQEQAKVKAEAEKVKREAEQSAKERAKAEQRRQEEEAARMAELHEEALKENAWKDSDAQAQRDYEERQAAQMRVWEEQQRVNDQEVGKMGMDMGKRLASWLYTEEGLTRQREITELLLRAVKKKEGLASLVGSTADRQARVDELINGMVNANTMSGFGYGAEITESIQQEWRKKGLNSHEIEKETNRLALDMTELACARRIDLATPDRRQNDIPVKLDPTWGIHDRYDFHYHLGLKYGGNSQDIYTAAFEKEWEATKTNFQDNKSRVSSEK